MGSEAGEELPAWAISVAVEPNQRLNVLPGRHTRESVREPRPLISGKPHEASPTIEKSPVKVENNGPSIHFTTCALLADPPPEGGHDGSRGYFAGRPSASRISTCPTFSLASSGSMTFRSPTAMTTMFPGTRYFFDTASVWSVVTRFTSCAYFV